MSALLTFDSVSAHTPDRHLLFHDLTLSLGAQRVGLVGRNGSGKSTLLRIAAGLAEPSGGIVRRSGTIGRLEQDWPGKWSLGQALGVAGPLEALGRILGGNGTADDFAEADWSLEARLETALAQTGLSSLALSRRMETLSGGERTRIGIARLIVEAPDLVLLDEPTNNLDAAGRAAIHTLIQNWRGGVLVASHDRRLLDGMERTVELTTIGARSFAGGWSAFASGRDADRIRAASERARADAAVRAARREVQFRREAKERRDKAGRAFAAKGSEPKILLDARAERAENSGGRAGARRRRSIDCGCLGANGARECEPGNHDALVDHLATERSAVGRQGPPNG